MLVPLLSLTWQKVPYRLSFVDGLELISVSWQRSVELIFPDVTYCGDPTSV